MILRTGMAFFLLVFFFLFRFRFFFFLERDCLLCAICDTWLRACSTLPSLMFILALEPIAVDIQTVAHILWGKGALAKYGHARILANADIYRRSLSSELL